MGALNQAKKLIPQALQNDDPRKAAEMLSSFGIKKDFINQEASKYMPYASKVPILGDKIKTYYEQLMGQMGGDTGVTAQASQPRGNVINFDRNKYPRI